MSLTSRRRQGTRGLCFTIGLLAATAHADVQSSFIWGFNTFTSTLLPECGRLQLYVNTSAGTTPPKPPYTLIAYEAGGIPTRQAVGSDITNLWWTVDHSSQSQLVLSMADAAGNAGGVGPNLYTVLPSSSGTACHPANPSSSVTLITNSTKSLQSCDVLPLKMSGGTKPYTITITPLGAAVSINFTLGSQFDTLDWVNRASPDTQLIASVSDVQGTYGGSTNLISTFGSKDLTCGNQQSTQIDSTGQSSPSGNQTSPSSNNSSSNSSSSHKSTSTPFIIGGIVGGVVIIGAVLLGIFLCRRRRSRRNIRYSAVGTRKGSGLGVRVPVLGDNDQNLSAAEMTPFAVTGGSGTPYTDNPIYQRSVHSSGPSEMTFGSEMQARASSYSVPPNTNTSPGASSFAVQQNLAPSVLTPPGTASMYDPYGRGSIAPSSPFESTSMSIAGPLSGAAYAAYAGSAAGSEARTGEAGPSSGVLAVANRTTQDLGDEKQGPVLPQAPRESIYQHEDISDVVELPPAYKERTDL